MPVTFAYWNSRGLGQPIRFMLAYTGTQYEDKRYTDREVWLKEKDTLGLEFPNLPYYIDDDVKLTESSAITRYLARKNGLEGSTEQERIRIDLAYGLLMDLARTYATLCYNENFETLKVDYIKKINEPISKISKILGSNKFVAGNRITWIDFLFFEMLERYQFMVPGCLDENLQQYYKRFQELPAIQKHMNSPTFQTTKEYYNGPQAKFGARK